jgi:carotenoid 1,2-hydratase
VFSPYYRAAHRRALASGLPGAEADNHCALNVCLYKLGAGGVRRWTMTERPARACERSRQHFKLGPSVVQWNGQSLDIEIDEWANPLPRRVRGRVRVHPLGLSTFQTDLDGQGRHRWGPIAPCARIEVDLHSPDLRWQGDAYVDNNEGDEPIERPFLRWDWLRTVHGSAGTQVIYDTTLRDGGGRLIGAAFDAQGRAERFEPPAAQALPASAWRVPAQARGGVGTRLLQRLEDTPFYSRSVIEVALQGDRRQAVHETLDVNRLVLPAVQWMLPWRMPRW